MTEKDDRRPPVKGFREPTEQEAAQVRQELARVREKTDLADHRSAAALAAVQAMKDMFQFHVDHCTEDKREAKASRSALYAKFDDLQTSMLQAIGDLRDDMTKQVSDLRGKLDGHRGWTVTLLLSISGIVILLLLGVIGWLIVELYRSNLEDAAAALASGVGMFAGPSR